jgi:hypothetical protein
MDDAETRMRCLELVVPLAQQVSVQPGGWERIFGTTNALVNYVKTGNCYSEKSEEVEGDRHSDRASAKYTVDRPT